MIVGIMADTHDHLPLVDKAVKVLNESDVELILHAGDYTAPFVIPHFRPLKARLIGVFGNNDGDRSLLKKRFEEIKAQIRGNFAEITVDGLRIALLHGSEEELLQSLISIKSHDILIYGHTHEAKTYRNGRTLVINPGEVCGYLTEKSTLALLNSQTKEVKTIQL